MKKLALFSVAIFSLLAQAQAGDAIYGTDDRKDVDQTSNSLESRLAESTAALTHSANLKKNDDGTWTLKTDTLGARFGLCRDEKFWDQPVGTDSSSALVGPDLILTAAHALQDDHDCRSTRVVFGFAMTASGKAQTTFTDEDVAHCKEIVHRDEKNDFMIFRLDRKITHRSPIAINRGSAPKLESEVVVIGNPSGLPTKVSPGRVKNVTRTQLLIDSDTFSGNSGSSVFNPITGLIEGVLVGGQSDYVNDKKNECVRAAATPAVRCFWGRCSSGEFVTAASLIAPYVPEL